MLQQVLKAQLGHPVLFLVVALVLSALSIVFAVRDLQFVTSRQSLVARDSRMVQLLEKADQFSELDSFVIVIENRDTTRTTAFADALVQRIKADKANFSQIFSGVDPARFRQWALLYLSKGDLSTVVSKVRDNVTLIEDLTRSPGLVTLFEELNNRIASGMVGELFTGFLEENVPGEQETPENLDFLVDLLQAMNQHMSGSDSFTSPWSSAFGQKGSGYEAEDGRIWTDGKKYLIVTAAPSIGSDGRSKGREALTALRHTVDELKAQFPNISAGVTGQKALDEDEMETAFRDMTLATVLSLLGLAALLMLFWRSVRPPLIEVLELLVALALTLGLTTLFIGHLNLLSIAFAPLLLGLGIDYGIHWFARYMEELRRAGVSQEEALSITMTKLGPAILVAGPCASLSFFPLMLTGFKGLVELGLICAMGMCLTTLTTLGLLPALILLFDRGETSNGASISVQKPLPFMTFVKDWRLALTGFAAVAFGVSIFAADKVGFDLNMLHLQSKHAESVVWEKKLIESSKLSSIHGVVFAHSLDEVDRKSRAIEKLPTVAEVQSVRSLLPSDQQEKLALLRQLKPVLANVHPLPPSGKPVDINRLDSILGRIRFKMLDSEAAQSDADPGLVRQMKRARELIDSIRQRMRTEDQGYPQANLKGFERSLTNDLNDKIDLLESATRATPMTMKNVPKQLFDRFVGPDNLFLIRVLPAHDIWQPDFLAEFVRELKSVDPDATGNPVNLSVFTRSFRDACIKASIYAAIFVFIFLATTLRSLSLTLAAYIPLILGTAWTFGLMRLFGVQLNLANTIFLPLIVGAGVEYGIIIVQRWNQDYGRASCTTLPSSTAKGVILAGLTTTVGFGSLMISDHQGIRSLGILTTIGSLSVLAAAIIFLPALLHLSAPLFFRKEKLQMCEDPTDGQKEVP